MTMIIEVELLDIWGIDIMGPFGSLYCQKYILIVVDYISKRVKAITLPNNNGKSVTFFLKRNIFSRFGSPQEIIINGSLHFDNKVFSGLLDIYGVKQRKVATLYRRHTIKQVEVQSVRLKLFPPRQWMLIGQTSPKIWMMPYRHIRKYSKHLLVCFLTNWFLAKQVTCWQISVTQLLGTGTPKFHIKLKV